MKEMKKVQRGAAVGSGAWLGRWLHQSLSHFSELCKRNLWFDGIGSEIASEDGGLSSGDLTVLKRRIRRLKRRNLALKAKVLLLQLDNLKFEFLDAERRCTLWILHKLVSPFGYKVVGRKRPNDKS
jgi:hypothetical protein